LGAEYTKLTGFLRKNHGLSSFIVLILILLSSSGLKAQQAVQVIWPLTNDAESVYTSGIGHTSFSYGTALKNFRFDSINGATSGGWDSRDLNKQAYFEYTITPEKDAQLTITQLKFEVSLSSVNMRTAVHWSKDGFTRESIPIGNTVYVGKRSSRDLLVETALHVAYPETLSIRIYGWSAPNAAVNFFARDVEFNGMVDEKEKEKGKQPEEEIANEETGDGGERSILAIKSYPVPGTYTWICPPNVFKVTVECWGGGGQGGDATGNNKAGGGGGGGGYSRLVDYTVVPGNSYTVTVGAGGVTLPDGTLTNGSDSWFVNTGLVLARGGKSVAENVIAGGAGGLTGVGTLSYTGGNGAAGNTATHGGGGGSSGGATGAGSNGNLSVGGIAPAGGGNGGNGYLATTDFPSGNGTDGNKPGGGGGGALSNTGSGNFVGGDGGDGQVIITFCVIPTAYNVTGGGSYCANGSGVPVGLNGSNTGISYQLYRDGLATGSAINGTGGALSFGNQTVAGTYTVVATNLDGGCTQNMTGNAIVVVNPQPNATISGTTTVCQNSTSPNITFTGSNGTSPYTFSYRINGGGILTISSPAGNPIALLPVPTNTVGTYLYTLVSVLDANGCSRAVAGSATVIVTPGTPAQPGAITGNTTSCPGITGLQYSISAVPNATIYTWAVPTGWSITGGQNTTTITVTAGAFGQNGDISVTAANNCGTSAPSLFAVSVLPGTPAVPGSITGLTNQCPNVTGQIYSVSPVTNATNYTWTVPGGWTINTGQGTNTIIVTTGNTGQNGNITVNASNSCGTSSPRSLAVNVGAGTPSAPIGINGPTAPCPNTSNLHYSINAVPNTTTYTWTVPGGWTITAGQGTLNITVTSGAFGNNGNVTVTAGNTCGTSAPATLAVTVAPGTPEVPGPISGNAIQCANLSGLIYSIDPVPNATSYTWTVPAGWNITAGQTTNTISVTTGLYGQNGNITVTASNVCGTSAPSVLAVSINPGAPATPGPITGITDHCFQQTGQIYTISSVTNATTYTWAVPVGWSITAGQGTTSITVTTGLPGQNGNITVTAGNMCGTSAASSLAVVVSTVPANTSPIFPAPATVCQGATLTFSVTAVAGVTYTWSFPADWTLNNGQGTNQATVTVGTQSGNISVIPSNTCGNGNPTTHAVTVTLLPANPGQISGDDSFCQGTIAKYIVANAPGVTFNWTVPAGWTITSGQGTHTIMTATTNGVSGNVTVTPSISCGSGPSSSLYVTVYPTPAAETGPDGFLCAGGYITIGAPPVNGNTYLWTSVPYELFNHNISNPTVQPFASTTYTLVETSPEGCENTNSITIQTNVEMVLTISPMTQEVCPGENFVINVTSNILGTTFTWERDNIDVLTGMDPNGTSVPITGALYSSNPNLPEISTFKIEGFSVGDNCGAQGEAIVTVLDDQRPEIICPDDPTERYTNPGTCSYTVVGAELDPIVNDNCAVTLTNDINGSNTLDGEVFNVGEHLIRWSAVDAGGLTDECEFTLVVKDNVPPAISCVGNQTVNVTTGCTYVHNGIAWDAIATDNCGVTSLTYTLSGATTGTGTTLNNVAFNVGVTTVIWDVSDGANVESCTFTVTVIDNLPPTISCPGDISASSNTGTCNASVTLTNPVISDNCAGTTLTYTITGVTTGNGTGFVPQPYIFNVGTSTVTYTLTDQAGLSVFCDFNVTVTDDTKPVVTCPTVNTSYPNNPDQCQATLSFTATATDDCGAIQSIKYYIGADEIVFPYNFPLGTTTVIVYATDIHGNVSIPCSFDVKVDDTQIPSIICAPGPQTRNAIDDECYYIVQGDEFDPTSVTDNCPGVTYICELTGTTSLAGISLAQGTHNLIWTATDASGNTHQCTLEVTINDGEAPVIICPANITEYTGAGSTTCSKAVTFAATGSDNCGTVQSIKYYIGAVQINSPYNFPVGTTTVTVTGTDLSGNTGTCQFTVTVIDNTPPTFTVPLDYTVSTTNNCTYDINPLNTGEPTVLKDNCGLKPAPDSPTYTDVIEAVPPCVGSYKVTRTWRVTDIHNNYTEKVQIINIRDNTPPVLTVPTKRTVECSDPASSYGVATATDNCDTEPEISFTDVVVNDPFCPAGKVITRTWRAEDCSGNFTTGVQEITVDDNTPPVIDNPGDITILCPSMIPTPSASGILAHDNCGSVTFEFLYDDPVFPAGATGYCPELLRRYFKASDQCSNTTTFFQTITIEEPLSETCACKECLTNNSHFDVDLENNTSVTISNVIREDKCCNAQKQEDCISFDVILPEWAVGVQIEVNSGHPENQFWKVDCELVTFLNGDFVCLPGGAHYLFTYCKAGDNANNSYTFTVLEGIITVPDLEARVNCNSIITANTTATNVTWQSISPGNPGDWNGYLTCLNPECTQVQFTPDEYAPPQIVYEVCGTIPDMPCLSAGGLVCDQITVNVRDSISVLFDVDPGAYCRDEIPLITAEVSPSGTTYVLQWFKQPDLTTVLATGYSYQPTSPGTYVLKVHDMDGDIPCPDYYYEFIVAPDDHPPVFEPIIPLELDCNDPANAQLINDWLASVKAIDDNTPVITVTNNYTPPIIQGCDAVTTITFTAVDECLNEATITSTITIRDTELPTWYTAANELNRSVDCNDAVALAEAESLEPEAEDFCDTDVEVIKTVGQLVPGLCPQSGTITNTWIAVDDCGNQSATVYTQVITVSDGVAPTWQTTAGSLNRNVTCADAAGLAAAQALVPVAEDVCDPLPIVTKTSGAQVPGVCPTLYTITNTFIATDHCGNASVIFTQVITVSDNVAPVINTQPSNLTVECDGSGNLTQLNNWLNLNGGAVATDACSAVTWSNNFTSLSDLCGATGSATVIFTAKDACNNSISTNAVTFTIVDTQAPSITCPPDVIAQINTANCTVDNVDLGTPTVSDGCSSVTVTNNAPAEFPAGVTIVTWTATDDCGNFNTCNQTVTVQDLIPPTVNCPVTPITVNADPGKCDAYIEVPAPVVTDPCPYIMTNDYTGTSSAYATYPVGTTTIHWTITGTISGAVNGECEQVINVIDNQAPTISCPGDQLFTAPPPACTLVVTAIPDPVIADNCAIANLDLTWEKIFGGITIATGSGSVNGTPFGVGTTTVVYTVTDDAGNTDFCNFTVTVNDDVPPTIISCPGNQTVTSEDGECFANVIVPLPEVIDPCGEIVSYENDFNYTTNASGQYPVGSTVVTWTFTDNSGNISTCQHTITVTDNQFPTISCPEDVTATAVPPLCEVPAIVVDDPVYSDNCPGAVLTWTKTGATAGSGTGLVNNTTFEVGVTVVRYTITDASGNSAWCEFTVTVEDDVPPTVTDCPDDITVSNDPGVCSANVIVPQPEVTDPCGEIVSYSNSFNGTTNASGQYPVGTTTVVWTFIDESNNITTCSHTVTVNDTELPTITCPENVTAIATPPDCVIPDYTLEAPEYGDNCGILSITWQMTGATTGSGTGVVTVYDMEVGVTTITYTVTDVNNNEQTCFFTVTINDQVPPTVIDCPDDITQDADFGVCNTYILVGLPVVDDPCDEIVSITHDSPVGTLTDPSGYYDVGEYIITWTFTDASGNHTHCTQVITVEDNQYPVFTFCPPDVIVEATPPDCEVPNVTLQAPVFTDNCPDAVLTYTMSGPGGPTSGTGVVTQTTFPVGTTEIIYTLTDASGNTAVCQFLVIVHDDVPPTIITCPPGQDVYPAQGECQAQVNIPPPVVTDPCGEIVSVSHNSPYGTPADPSGIYPVGVYNITWTFTDESGNTVTCLQVIRVIDNQIPVIDCPDDITAIATPPDCIVPDYALDLPVITENCTYTLTWAMTGDVTANGTGILTEYDFPVGVTNVTYTVTDASGNIAECTFIVTINDQVPPTVIDCPDDITANTTHDLCQVDLNVPKPVVTDPCGEIVTITNDSPYGNGGDDASGTYPVGDYDVTWTFTDESGNTSECIQHIIVIDDINPDLDCPDPIVVNADFEQPYASNVTVPPPTYWDACGIETLSYVVTGATPFAPGTGEFPSPNTFNVGVTTITYTAIDVNGNVSTCWFTVTVISKPEIICPLPITENTDPGKCYATINPGGPTLVSGVEPITWTYRIEDKDGNQLATGTCTTANLATCIGDFQFPVGENTIYWRAQNISGFDECTQTVTVFDDEPPTYTQPGPFERCVNQIITAKYDGMPEPDAGIMPINPAHGNPRRPDWYLVPSGSTELDLPGLSDNCCELEDINISWTIVFDPITGYPPISGTRQPSLSTPIYLWGTYTNVNVTHVITYTISDCNGNEAEPISRNLLITPRPDIIKQY